MDHSGFVLHDHIALLAYIKDLPANSTTKSQPRPTARQERLRACNRFTQCCQAYRQRLEKHARAAGTISDAASRFASYLYNPSCWLAFGKTDQIGLVLLDDFDPIFEITSEVEVTIERIAVAFLPDVDKLDLEERDTEYLSPLSTMLSDGQNHLNSSKSLPESASYQPHPFEQIMPLVAISRFKLGVLASMGQGLRFQRSLYRAIARRIRAVIDDLREHPLRGTLDIRDDDLDISRLKCSLLNPQGFDEIGIIIRTCNYSVAAAILMGLRNLSMADVYADADEGKSLQLLRSQTLDETPELLKRFETAEGELRGYAIPKYIEQLLNSPAPRPYVRNHVFMSAYTTLGVSHDVFWNANRVTRTCHGYSRATAQFQIHPGHEEAVTLGLEPIPLTLPGEKIKQEDLQLKSLCDEDGIEQDGHNATNTPMILEMGPNDMSCTIADSRGNEILFPRGIPTSHLFASVARFFAKEAKLSEFQGGEAGLRAATCVITVPFPQLKHHVSTLIEPDSKQSRDDSIKEYFKGHAPVEEALNKLSERVKEHLEPGRVAKALRNAGVPRSLRFAVRYLFQDFFVNLANPGAVDGVLDLYDAFATLHYVLEHSLPERAEKGTGNGKDFFVLKDVIDAFQNALSHRVSANHGFHELHDMSIDWRGGMNQLTEAADVPMKCALSLLARLASPQTSPLVPGFRYERVANVTAIKLTPSARCSHALFGGGLRKGTSADKWHSLSYLHANVGHVFHPWQYMSYLHEGAHLLQPRETEYRDLLNRHTAFLKRTAKKTGNYRLQAQAKSLVERHDEQFANAITFWFVFAGDKPLFLRAMFSQFGMYLSPRESDGRRARKFVTLALWLFMAVDPCEHESDWSSEELDLKRRSEMHERFQCMLKEYAPFANVSFLSKEGEEIWSYSRSVFNDALNESRAFAYCEFEKARKIYEWYALESKSTPWCFAATERDEGSQSSLGANSRDRLRIIRDKIKNVIAKCLADGQSMIGDTISLELKDAWPTLFAGPNGSSASEYPVPSLGYVDNMIIVCETLRAYHELVLKDLTVNKGLYVPRDSKDGKCREIDFSSCADPSGWNEILFDPGSNGLFCVDPKTRRDHMRYQVAVLKKFWDLSTALRGRRLHHIVSSFGNSEDITPSPSETTR